MGYQILRTPPLSSSKTLIFSKLVSPPNLAPTSLFKTHFRPFVSKPIVTVPNFVTGFGGASFQFQQSTRSLRGGVVAMAAAPGKFKKSEEWQAILSPEQFRILRQKGTEYPGIGEYEKFFGEGVYQCAGCGTPLYRSTTKFNSGCGWPAFYEGLPGAINHNPDPDGMRIEVTCATSGGNLGRVFKGEGFPTPTDERRCVTSISLKFAPANSYASE